MEQNTYRVPIKALPHDIQTIVQQCIKGSGQDVRLINQLKHDHQNKPTKRTSITQPEKKHVHSYKSIKEAVKHARAAWTKQKALVQQNTRFNILRDKTPVIPPAKFTGQYKNIE